MPLSKDPALRPTAEMIAARSAAYRSAIDLGDGFRIDSPSFYAGETFTQFSFYRGKTHLGTVQIDHAAPRATRYVPTSKVGPGPDGTNRAHLYPSDTAALEALKAHYAHI